MIYDISGLIKDFNNEPILISKENEPDKHLTIKKALLDVCGSQSQGETLPGEEKIIRFKLGIKIASAEKEVDLTTTEAAKIIELNKRYSHMLVMGRVLEIFEPSVVAPKEDKT